MIKRAFALTAMLTLLAASLPFGNSTGAQSSSGDQRLLSSTRLMEAGAGHLNRPRGQRNANVTVFVELAGEPAIRAYAERKGRGASEANAPAEAKTALSRN